MKRTKIKEIGGVCGGIAKDLSFDVFFIRLLFVILLFTDFPIVFVYCLIWIFTSEEK